jgi:hypothetical protein
MNETTRTLSFVGVAVVLAAVAYGTHIATRPPTLADFSDVGEEFYPDFRDARAASGLRVAAYNEDAARVDVFNVEVRDGRWTIPSHHNYPADGEERLANTATSIIGLKREALASTSADDHKRLGVLDPLDETIAGTEGRGDRITLTKGDDVLADYIVGTRIEDGPENTFHVRRADEDRTYRATLDLDISTKFADWIEPDLLDFRRGDIRELVIDRYSIDETIGQVIPGDQNVLTRSSLDDPWKLAGLDEATEEVKTSTVNQMINALEDLAIVGVRPKPKGLSANLKGEGSGGVDTLAIADLEQKGFFIDSRGMLVSNEGDVRLGTSDGVMYVLRFGEVFTGSDVEIEVGSSGEADASEDADAETDDETASAESPEDSAAEDDGAEDEDGSVKRSRYVFITTQFSESYIDPLDEKPVKPEAPGDAKEQAEEEEKSENKDESPDADDEGTKDETEGDEEKPNPQAEYETALAEYETKLKEWEQSETERKEKVEAGQKRVQELNARFADWYYVISAESFDDIRVSRDELVEKKEPETTEGADADSTTDAGPPAATGPAIAPSTDETPDGETTKPAAEPEEKESAAAPETGAPKADKPEEPQQPATSEPPPADKPEQEESPDAN